MKRVCCLLLALAFLLCGCAQQKAPSAPLGGSAFLPVVPGERAPEDSKAPEKAPVPGGDSKGEPDDSPEESSNPEPDMDADVSTDIPLAVPQSELAIPQKLADFALYKQALETPNCIIVYNDKPLTGHAPVDAFLQAIESDGADGETDLVLYDFSDRYGYYSVDFHHFTFHHGVIHDHSAYLGDWVDSDVIVPKAFELAEFRLSEYGYLVYRRADLSEPSSHKVISDFELYPDAAACIALRDTYLTPIELLLLGSTIWDEPEDLWQWPGVFEDLYYHRNGVLPNDVYGENWPIDDVIALLSEYFDGITFELLSENEYYPYDPETRTIFNMGGRGGYTPIYRVTNWRQEGDLRYIAYIVADYQTGDPLDGEAYVLTVRLKEDGSFRYVSNLPLNAMPGE